MATLSFLRIKSSAPDLRAEILRDYRNIVILQVLIILSALVLGEALKLMGMEASTVAGARDTVFLVLGGLYVYILWDFLRNLTRSQIIVTLLFVLIIGSYLLTLYTINPFYDFIGDEEKKRPFLFIIHMVLFIVEAFVIYHAIMDLFQAEKAFKEKLWGSASVFLMIGISFGSVYDLISIANPGALGIPVQLGLESYTLCIQYSMSIIGGRDAMENAIPLVQGIAVVEAVWSNLFVILLVGRLLSQPSPEK